jgi:hypothetical protein
MRGEGTVPTIGNERVCTTAATSTRELRVKLERFASRLCADGFQSRVAHAQLGEVRMVVVDERFEDADLVRPGHVRVEEASTRLVAHVLDRLEQRLDNVGLLGFANTHTGDQ